MVKSVKASLNLGILLLLTCTMVFFVCVCGLSLLQCLLQVNVA